MVNQIAGKYHCAVLGVSYKTAAATLRDSLSKALLTEDALKRIRHLPGVSEVVILATCNRAEIYVATLFPEALTDALVQEWATLAGISLDDIIPHCYYLTHGEAVSHLYAVVSSIDSLVLGENQILGQVRDAFLQAQSHETTGILLNHLFQSALSVGKQVRDETDIGVGTVSVAHAAMDLCKKILGDFKNLKVGILGTGEMGRLTAKTFADENVSDFAFFNRTFSKAENFTKEFGGQAFPLDALITEIPKLDILITCAQAPHFLVQASKVPSAMRGNLMIVDIASPRNVDPLIGSFPGVRLYCIDDLNKVVEKNRHLRKRAAEQTEKIIEDAIHNFKKWFSSKDLAPLLQQMQEYHQLVGEMVLDKWSKKTSPETMEILKRFEDELRKKILFIPFDEIRRLSLAGMAVESQLILEKLYSVTDFKLHFNTKKVNDATEPSDN